MSDQPTDLVLEHLKRMQASLFRLEHGQQELIQRVAGVEEAIRHQARGATVAAADVGRVQVQVDRLRRDMDRVQTRLGLVDE